MRQYEHEIQDAEFPTRFILDEARFSGGREHIFNEEDKSDEATADHT